jgi:hypothetical protein
MVDRTAGPSATLRSYGADLVGAAAIVLLT